GARCTQIADATAPVCRFSPCQTPPVGGRSRRLRVTASLYSANPSCASASTTSRGCAAHACSISEQCILPLCRSSFSPCSLSTPTSFVHGCAPQLVCPTPVVARAALPRYDESITAS